MSCRLTGNVLIKILSYVLLTTVSATTGGAFPFPDQTSHRACRTSEGSDLLRRGRLLQFTPFHHWWCAHSACGTSQAAMAPSAGKSSY